MGQKDSELDRKVRAWYYMLANVEHVTDGSE